MLYKIFNFYKEGFLSMRIGRKLWMIIGIKLFILFVILKIFFFNDFLSSKFSTNQQKANYVFDEITNIKR